MEKITTETIIRVQFLSPVAEHGGQTDFYFGSLAKITTGTIIRVQFLSPVAEHGGQTDFYFGSLAAIYEVFTPEQVGCKLETLWSAKIDQQHPKVTPRCVVSKQVLYRKKQKNSKF